ncbi:hypothetical protein KVT40_007192 [Elsinoe batatas]|uniref:DNA ligase D 3'-phosphoesterase domain-containing protein n=1 Tax=Elsinoe batatas TaxID=2601811 RepID=A0A8K0PD92_9PEZI|nr:hypothetical protein KVT40_007192 [Elsinoe batatas]
MTDIPRSLKRRVSPPPTRKSSKADNAADVKHEPTPADVEAGQADVIDHVQYWHDELSSRKRKFQGGTPCLPLQTYRELYVRNQTDRGCHFVIQQHDHPVSGVHYDLRLQFSKTSSLSFSVPYGVPGHQNSIRPNRMAIETRVHNVWNNLIESASHATGSLLIWDTGEYEVRPRPSKTRKTKDTDDELSAASDHEARSISTSNLTEPQKLRLAFQDRHIHLRLHSTRLSKNYTLALRLPRQNFRHNQPRAPKRRRRHDPSPKPKPSSPETTASDTDTSLTSTSTAPSSIADEKADLKAAAAASDDEDSARDERERGRIRETNAYPGATNDIDSVHQRQWFMALDREASGFVKRKGTWERREGRDGELSGFEKFVVGGREVERSIVTGRLAGEVMEDAGVKGFRGRKMWRAITE